MQINRDFTLSQDFTNQKCQLYPAIRSNVIVMFNIAKPLSALLKGALSGVTGNTFWKNMGNRLFHKYTEYQ